MNWSLESYIKIAHIRYVEECVELYKKLPENIIKKCMLFVMREGINPLWEDVNNINGGCFSYKVNENYVTDTWIKLNYMLVGETLIKDKYLTTNINGLSISPKKHFNIIKVWLKNKDYNKSNVINDVKPHIVSDCCVYKTYDT